MGKQFANELKEVEEIERKRSLKRSIYEANAWSVMYGFGETYMIPFAVALKATAQQIGFLSSVPRLISSITQLHAAKITDTTKRRKLITALSVFLQAIVFLPLLLIPFLIGRHSILLLTVLFSLYWIFGQFAGPAWSSWMGDLVKENERGSYFGKRNWISGFVSFVAVIIAGIVLEAFSKVDVFVGFAILFAVALISRLISFYYLTKMYEPDYKVSKSDYFSFKDYLKRLPSTNYGNFTIYFSLLTFATQVAAPFFTVFMLRDLKMSYLIYMILISASGASTFISMIYWGKNSDKFGNKKILAITGICVSIVPWLWLVSHSVVYLFFIQLFAGFTWAGFNLAAFNFLFDTVRPSKRTRCVAYQNVLLGIAIFIGTTIGGFLTIILPTPSYFISNIETVFIVSGVLRLAASIIWIPKIQEVMPVTDVDTKVLFWNLIAVRPVRGIKYQAVTGASKTVRMFEKGVDNLKKSKNKFKRF